MRFKAKIVQDKLLAFAGVIGAIEKIGTACVVHLTETRVHLSVQESGSEGVDVYAELIQDMLFHEYRIESRAGNAILFEANASLLLQALNSGKTSPTCQIKLAKRAGQPCLSIETRALEIEVVHDIPVKVMPANEAEYYLPPKVHSPQVQLELPRQRSLRTVVDRMKAIDKFLFVDADMGGQLVFRVEKADATIKTFYSNLTPRFEEMDANTCRKNMSSVKVDVKKLAAVMSMYALRFDTAICCIIGGYSLVLHVILSPINIGNLTYYVPVMDAGDDLAA
ncbi:conserved unknown protein [Ectocarpus siliculosus]|uniref:Checkpoint protein n=1 Tax=Ectocarpus siliculosus TaxID=2880 RepID=D7FRE2_ECTSI|nr:conserved unknown protein [Ectocarpus siliculosus]|eukprot:CBJ30733.1 conserved unknown protein [Ectocarpus siliculosus]